MTFRSSLPAVPCALLERGCFLRHVHALANKRGCYYKRARRRGGKPGHQVPACLPRVSKPAEQTRATSHGHVEPEPRDLPSTSHVQRISEAGHGRSCEGVVRGILPRETRRWSTLCAQTTKAPMRFSRVRGSCRMPHAQRAFTGMERHTGRLADASFASVVRMLRVHDRYGNGPASSQRSS